MPRGYNFSRIPAEAFEKLLKGQPDLSLLPPDLQEYFVRNINLVVTQLGDQVNKNVHRVFKKFKNIFYL